ncbi:CLAVATA3/ESR (CLE)-related protein 25-like [Durio zibethinus]|uniref:CLAVATA3/ESR (CLE)-related protein 25-like n=1 Tax=Durio zibethinus TaxID=66656 RepID=A0A6P5XDD6_DURZI|nr:CLAVATA3/ESR (CLE)-related protein 25-like [Durio zibethinus]
MGGSSGSSGFLSSRTLFGSLMVLGFILVMLVGSLQNEGNKTKTTLTSTDDDQLSSTLTSTSGKLQQEEQVKVLGRAGKSSVVHPPLDLNYMSNRRVPNGPDPIHNRRAGNSGRPPGQA